ncbi:MAG: DUF4292 domain-containing protein [Desulfobacterales bacterium]|nr:DUF4292 domain-containing protein [Desulfobacterales bacterium]
MKAAVWPVVLIVSVIFFSSCASFKEKPYTLYIGEDAQQSLDAIKKMNVGLLSIKGIGNVKIINADFYLSSRFAWAVSNPDRIRMNIFDVSGKPLATAASDGNRFYFLSHTDQQFYEKTVSSGILKRLISIPISFEDVLLLFSGRIPVRDHYSATFEPDSEILILSGRTRLLEKIYFESDKMTPRKIEMFGRDDALRYRVQFEKNSVFDGFGLPGIIAISDDNGNLFRIQVDRYWPNASVSDSVFIVEQPEAAVFEN